jgi:hypothetical protein
MRSIKTMLPIVTIAVLIVTACFYDPDRSKIAQEDANITDAAAVDSGAGSDWPWSGLGMVCDSESGECEEYDADYCLADPSNPGEPGRCTIKGCDIKGCPNLYKCCDCSGVGMEIMCVPDAYAELISTYCQCS